MNYPLPSPDYLSLADLSLRSFGSPDSPYACWSHNRPALEPWHTLMGPYAPFHQDQPPSPTETCFSFASSSSTAGTPPPRTTHVVCNAPLVAPIPLPYHSPTFLQFELPDIDEDLSHPPYTRRQAAVKRKRTADREEDSARPQKRRLSVPVVHPAPLHAGPCTRSSTRAAQPYRYHLRR
ncbi:hypothetical protein DFH08DRAFT_864825 [Mycena albidolilacea]|uniref:Uncharacterized protein n=1 Tax=Mycena albidolilacea TaxID=1033008 RepID=A0AAD7ESF5_9AGAR|nr:hypothetical protein DFH08DRAFT_864825 [Mycena albidolilacea]